MFRRIGGEVYGVLNDFDLACGIDSANASPTSNQRTGTKPFMAIDLLSESPPPRHLYRHDLESFFHVLVFMTSTYLKGTEIQNPLLQSWLTKTMEGVVKEKISFIMLDTICPTSDFRELKNLLTTMRYTLACGFTALLQHKTERGLANEAGCPSFNQDTLGGHVTFDKFVAAFGITP
jgi:hypothetical protein